MFGNQQLSPELLMALGGGIMQGQNLGQGLGTGFQNAAAVMGQQKEQAQAKEAENATRSWVQKQFPNEDVSQMPTPMLRLYAEQAFKQRFAPPEKAEFKSLPDGTYGAWDGRRFNVLGKAEKPEDIPAAYQDFQLQQSDPAYREHVQQQTQAKDAPPIAKEYEWAKTQGFNGTPQEYQAWKANLSKQKGMTVSYDPVNGFQMTQGDVDKAPPKLTEAQSKDINFLTRAKKAEEQLAPLENELTSWAQKRLTGLPFDTGNYLQSKEYQQAQQAGREILAIILRKDTGAAVTPQEFEVYSKIYLPQPGEDKATIEAKRLSREAAIQGIQAGLGPLAPTYDAATPSATDGYNTTTTGTKWRVPGQ